MIKNVLNKIKHTIVRLIDNIQTLDPVMFQRLKYKKWKKIIEKSGLFDAQYYLLVHQDIKTPCIDPIEHYILYGVNEGKNPSERFDTNFYLESYPDAREARINPLVHFIKYGSKERRSTHSQNSIVIVRKISKIKKLVTVVKYIYNNPQLIKRTIFEIKLYGIRRTFIKIKNKSSSIESSFVSQIETKSIEELFNIFNKSIIIPDFKIQKPIDIIIPVYNGFEFLTPLLNSIVKNTFMKYRIIMCDDKSPNEKVLPLLKHFKEHNPQIETILLENEQNLGFIKTVNRLVKYTESHFVLLNTDTQVPPYWIERLMYPIFEMHNIASTTPFTNAGTICSFPNYLEDNPIFENMTPEELDGYFQYVNFEKTYIEIPTGVGFCMGVNKNLVDKIGMFDEIFGKGYGEENDWCQRAIQNGYKNLHVTNLFVYHKHGGSFTSQEKQRLISQNLHLLNQKHPTYDTQVQSLIEKNELETIREFMQIKIKNKKLNTTLIIDHGLGGGANHYIDESMEKRIQNQQMTVLVRYDFHALKAYNIYFISHNLEHKFVSSNLAKIIALLSEFKINEIFLNSFVSYPNVHEIINEIVLLKEQTKAKLILPIHDFFPLCPSYTLLNEKMQYCEVPDDVAICENCLKHNKNEYKIFADETNIEHWRSSWSKIIAISDEILCFSNSSREIFLKAYPDSVEKITIKPHDISGRYPKIYDANHRSSVTIIGVLGAINEAKGANIVKDLVLYIDKNKLNAKVVVIGEISVPINSRSFEATGRYDKKELPKIVKRFSITKFLVPSICPETFSYTTDEIMQMGYPLVVFDLGAPAQRVRDYDLGKVTKINRLYEVIFE